MPKKPFKKGAAWMEGKIIPIEKAKIQVNDWGLVHSDITYDVVPVCDGAFFRLEDYIARFQKSIQSLKMNIKMNSSEIKSALMEMVAKSALKNAYVAMVASRGLPIIPGTRDPRKCKNHFYAWCVPYIFIMKPDLENKKRSAWVSKSIFRIPETSVDPKIKNYHWGDFTAGLIEAKEKGYETVILMDAEGNITEGPGFNVFAVKDNTLITSNHSSLEGISRRTIIEIASELNFKVEERSLPYSEFMNADEVFLSSSGGGVIPLTRVDDRIFANESIGPITEKFHKNYWNSVELKKFRTNINYN